MTEGSLTKSGTDALRNATVPLARTLPDVLREQAGIRPEAAAVFFGGTQISFSELYLRATRVASSMHKIGIKRGDRVGLLLGNGIHWLEIFFGASMAGAIVVPMSTWSTRAELEFLISDSRICTLFLGPIFAERNFESDLADFCATGKFETLRHSIIVSTSSAHGFQTFDEFVGTDQLSPLPPGEGPSAADDAAILYTSGSTSAPKGVRLKHHGIVENGFNIGERQGLRPGDRVFLSAPLFWSYGGANALPASFTHGAALVMPEKFEAESALSLIESTACTAIYTLPAMTNAMVRHEHFSRSRTKTLRTGVTIGSPQDFMTAAEQLGIPELCNIYGATETYGNCAVTWHHWTIDLRANCQGAPLPGQEMRFRDLETGAELPMGETGLVEVRGYITPGYTGVSAELNDKVFTKDGFYRTGDIGFINSDGAFVFVGRDSEMIKRAGINVSPAEIEDVLRRFPGVAQSAVVGVPDTVRGELIVSFVVPKKASTLLEDDLIKHCRSLLSKYKIPDFMEITDSLPETSTGKLMRKALKQAASDLVASKRGDQL